LESIPGLHKRLKIRAQEKARNTKGGWRGGGYHKNISSGQRNRCNDRKLEKGKNRKGEWRGANIKNG
jgi:hypothetical protein